MMYNNPFYRFPFYRPYHSSHSYSPYYQQTNHPTTPEPFHPTISVIEDCSSETKDEEDRQFFDILGIRLYFDDILLICLIFFLYQEGVKDQSLFISLILLLLS